MIREWKPKPAQPSPILETGIGGWLAKNLFSSIGNSCLTLLGIAFLLWALPPFLRWAIFDANLAGDSRSACDAAIEGVKTGACWVFIKVRAGVFLYGFYPEPERWRVDFIFVLLAFALLQLLVPTLLHPGRRQVALGLVAAGSAAAVFGMIPAGVVLLYFFLPFLLAWLAGRISGPAGRGDGAELAVPLRVVLVFGGGVAAYLLIISFFGREGALAIALFITLLAGLLLTTRRMAAATWRWILLGTLYPLLAYFFLLGGVFGLPLVETHFWGGLSLTLVVAGSGMITALPIGILLALGRRSRLPVINTLCVSFIEFVRGVPLVSVLFMASVMFPLLLPENVNFDKLLRALVGIAFFYAAYMAEVIRGGLQAIPKGQYEAAEALGWTYWKMMGLIILPQALRLVIPGLANNFLSLLKDTTLVAVIGLLDLLGIAKAAMADVQWLGFTKEAYIFAGLVFWIFCFAISRYSVYLERKYHTSYQ
ncbi:MAG TPA: amino acid ABC transporter permease [Desulforhopalus sp.]|nr:amino acid ABC transporter permease [Desulforhopalus sp.]